VNPARTPVLPALLVAAALLTGCSSTPATPSPESTASADADLGVVTTAPDGVQEVTLQTGDDYVFTPDTFTVAQGTVRLTVQNVASQMTHQFEFTQGTGPEPITATIPFLPPGKSETIEFAVTAAGDYPFDCTFHAALGQVGVMTVQG
jgi:plastocyanin